MEQFLRIGLHVLCYTLIMLSLYIFYTTLLRYMKEDTTPWKWILLSLFFVVVFLGCIGYTQYPREISPIPIDWGVVDTYIGLGVCVLIILLSLWILSHMYDFTLYAFVCGVDPLEKKNWHRNGFFFTCYLDVPRKKIGGLQMVYKGMDIIYSEDDGGYYAQDFSQSTCPTSEVYEDLEELKRAIKCGTIKLR